MSFYYTNVKRYTRGATWPSGDARMCTPCQADEARRRRNQATVIADLRRKGSPFKVPVGYCDTHTPEGIGS